MSGDLVSFLSMASSAVGIISGPIGLYFSYQASKKAGQAVSGSNELARRVSKEALYDTDADGKIVSVRTQVRPPQ